MATRGPSRSYETWSSCDECGFQGIVRFDTRPDEDYSDAEALGYMMDSTCPACGYQESVLVLVETYEEMVFMARHRDERSSAEPDEDG